MVPGGVVRPQPTSRHGKSQPGCGFSACRAGQRANLAHAPDSSAKN